MVHSIGEPGGGYYKRRPGGNDDVRRFTLRCEDINMLRC